MNLRLLPILMFATIALLTLKSIEFLVDGSTGFSTVIIEAAAQDAAATDSAAEGDGKVQGETPEEGSTTNPAALPAPDPGSISDNSEDLGKSRSERAVLGRLRERREQLDARERQLQLREQLLRAAEKRIERRVVEMKALEERIGVATTEKAAQEKKEFQNLAKMYQAMKPADAARIFSRLELSILVKVAKAMKPTKLADVMGKMSGDAAERLTVELATGGTGMGSAGMGGSGGAMTELPKISGN